MVTYILFSVLLSEVVGFQYTDIGANCLNNTSCQSGCCLQQHVADPPHGVCHDLTPEHSQCHTKRVIADPLGRKLYHQRCPCARGTVCRSTGLEAQFQYSPRQETRMMTCERQDGYRFRNSVPYTHSRCGLLLPSMVSFILWIWKFALL